MDINSCRQIPDDLTTEYSLHTEELDLLDGNEKSRLCLIYLLVDSNRLAKHPPPPPPNQQHK